MKAFSLRLGMSSKPFFGADFASFGNQNKPSGGGTPTPGSWTLGSDLGVISLAAGAGVIIAGSIGGTMYVSSDGGLEWTETGTSDGTSGVGALAYGGGSFVTGSISDIGWQVSTDTGSTWSALVESEFTYPTLILTNGSGDWISALDVSNELASSSDPATSWTYKTISGVSATVGLSIGIFDGDNLYFATEYEGNTSIVQMDGFSSTFSTATEYASGTGTTISFLAYGAGAYLCSDSNATAGTVRIASTAADLASATPVATGLTHAIIGAISLSNFIMVFDNDGNSAYSNDGGSSWTTASMNLDVDDFAVQLIYDPVSGNLVAVTDNGYIATASLSTP